MATRDLTLVWIAVFGFVLVGFALLHVIAIALDPRLKWEDLFLIRYQYTSVLPDRPEPDEFARSRPSIIFLGSSMMRDGVADQEDLERRLLSETGESVKVYKTIIRGGSIRDIAQYRQEIVGLAPKLLFIDATLLGAGQNSLSNLIMRLQLHININVAVFQRFLMDMLLGRSFEQWQQGWMILSGKYLTASPGCYRKDFTEIDYDQAVVEARESFGNRIDKWPVWFEDMLVSLSENGTRIYLVALPYKAQFVADVGERLSAATAKLENLATGTENTSLLKVARVSDESFYCDHLHVNPDGRRELTNSIVERIKADWGRF